jgi:hypothetical protein
MKQQHAGILFLPMNIITYHRAKRAYVLIREVDSNRIQLLQGETTAGKYNKFKCSQTKQIFQPQ